MVIFQSLIDNYTIKQNNFGISLKESALYDIIIVNLSHRKEDLTE